jgi:hypothetical protein
MFDIDCPRHGTRVLVPARHVVRLESGPEGVVAHVRCWCGEVVRWRGGRGTRRPSPVAA